MPQIAIDKATAAQLRHFAITHLGLEVPQTCKITDLVRRIRDSGYDEETIEVREDAPKSVPASEKSPGKRHLHERLYLADGGSLFFKESDTTFPDKYREPNGHILRGNDGEIYRQAKIPWALQPFVTIIIPTVEGKDGDKPVFLSVNGTPIIVKRATPQRVRLPFLTAALSNAVKVVYEQEPGEDDTKIPEITSREVPAYHFNVLEVECGRVSGELETYADEGFEE
ncbi:MAG: hypothetical protein HQL56_06895 [Magnetococcales bacterium]|nr:hypothetical protein [Magnetococcales bacterium]